MVTFIDFTAAFDSVSHRFLDHALGNLQGNVQSQLQFLRGLACVMVQVEQAYCQCHMQEQFLGCNSKRYRSVIREFRQAARETKIPLEQLYDEKIPHLREKYRESEDEKTNKIPNEMQE